MQKLMILIPPPIDPDRFEAGWPQFLEWAEQMPGLRREVTSRVSSRLYGDPPLFLVHELIFDDPASARRALESPVGQSAGRTLQAITQGQVSLYLADHMEDTLENLRPPGPAQEPEGDHGNA